MAPINQQSDEELMQAYLYGHYEAFEELYRRYSSPVWNYLKKFIQDEQTLSEAMQESFLKLHKSRERYDTSKTFRPWLFTISHNALMDILRKKGRIREVQGLETDTFPGKLTFAEKPIDEQLLESLNERDRRVISLRFEQDLTYKEVAEVMGLSQPNARKILSRSLAKVKKLLGGQI